MDRWRAGLKAWFDRVTLCNKEHIFLPSGRTKCTFTDWLEGAICWKVGLTFLFTDL